MSGGVFCNPRCHGTPDTCDYGAPYRWRWLEMINQDVELVKAIIAIDNPRVKVVVVPCNSGRFSGGCCCDRVLLHVDMHTNKVCNIPQVG